MELATFNRFRELIYAEGGICLAENKIPLLSARIAKRMRALGSSDYAEYFQVVAKDDSRRELTELLDAVSTNVTHFFRENHHFEFLATLLRNRRETTPLRVWCAAASTGEEPYSIAFTMAQNLAPGTEFEILGSDISTRALAAAAHGIFRPDTVRQLPPATLKAFFQISTGKGGALLRVKKEIRERVHFQRINLAKPPYAIPGGLDFIFCRNVMIYFDDLLRKKMIRAFAEMLKPGGYLFVGTSESILGQTTLFQNKGPSIHQKKAGAVSPEKPAEKPAGPAPRPLPAARRHPVPAPR